MWKAIIAKKEDDFYYLLKLFADSLDDSLLKAAKQKDRPKKAGFGGDSVALLVRLMNQSKEELNSNVKKLIEPLEKELNELTEKNKKLIQELNTKQKQKDIKLQSTAKLTAELSNLNMTLRGKKLNAGEKTELTQKIKKLRQKLDKINAKNKRTISSEEKRINESSKETSDKIKENDSRKKELISEMEKIKIDYRIEQRDDALTNYMKAPSEENLNKFQSLFFTERDLFETKTTEGKTTAEQKSPLKFNKKQLDADLKTLGWDGTGETAKKVLDNIKTGKTVNLQSKKFSTLDLTANVTNKNYVRQLKSLIKENKSLLDSLTTANRLLSFEGDPREYFRNVLDTQRSRPVKGKSSVKNKFDMIHSQHRGAVLRINQVLNKIYNSNQTSEADAKTAYKLSRKLISAVKDLDKFDVYESQDWKRGKVEIKEVDKDISSSDLFNTTIQVYEEILEDLNLSASQERSLAEEGQDSKEYEKVEGKIDSFVSKLKSNENLQAITIDILNGAMLLKGNGLRRFVTSRAYDKKYRIHYSQKFSEENKTQLVNVMEQIKEELSNEIGAYVTYYDKINDVLDASGFIDKRLTRGTISQSKLSRALSDSADTDSARKYLSKNLMPLLTELNKIETEERSDSKVADNMKFEELENYIENPKDEKFNNQDLEFNGRYLRQIMQALPDTKLGKKINRVFRNQRTQQYLEILGLINIGAPIQSKKEEEE